MKIMNELLWKIKDIESYHRNDRDGYGMMNSYVKFYADLSEEQKMVFWDIIFEWVKGEDEWRSRLGIRLFVEIQKRIVSEVIGIVNVVPNSSIDARVKLDTPAPSAVISQRMLDIFIGCQRKSLEWKNDVIKALLDVCFKKVLPFAVKYIQDNFYQGEHHFINPALSSLCHVDMSSYIDLTSRYLADNLVSGKYNELVKNGFAAFVINLSEERPRLNEAITALVTQTRNLNNQAGEELKQLLLYYFSESYIKNKFDEQTISEIIKQIQQS